MADEDEDDPVAEEYPTRPAAITYDKTPCLAARVKPKQQKVMLEMSLNTRGPSYCTSKGEQLAYEVDDGVSEDKKFFKSDVMDKQVLLSSQGTMSTSQYALGLFKDGELHLTPLKGVVQLRPNFEYLDRGKEKKPNANEDGDSQDEEEEKPTALSVRFAKKETEHAKAQRLSSYKYLEKQMAEEQWMEVNFYGINEARSAEEKDLLFCQEMNTEVLEFDPSPSNYIEALMPSAQPADKRDFAPLPQNTISMTYLRKLDLIDQVKTLLINAKLMSFSEVCSLVHLPSNEPAVLKCVQQHAVLVQGCWVIKSELLYPKGKTSAFSSATAETLCRGRDFVLYKFTKSRSVQRQEIISVIKLTLDDVNEIIKQVAKRNVVVGWEFKLPYDEDFVERYGDVVKQQNALWAARYRTLCEIFKLPKEDVERKDEGLKNKTCDKAKPAFNHGTDKLNDSILNQAIKMETDLPNGYGKATAEDWGGERELSAEDQEKRFGRLVKFVKDKLNTGTLSLAELKKLILLHQTVVSPGDILSSGVSDALLLKAIHKCGGEEIDLKWPHSSNHPFDLNSRRMFVVRAIGSPLDKYRSVILDLFHGGFAVQRKAIMEKSKEVLGSSPTNFEYSRLIQELGLERKGSSWYIRGTLPSTTPPM